MRYRNFNKIHDATPAAIWGEKLSAVFVFCCTALKYCLQ
jgi:hypothetical protein